MRDMVLKGFHSLPPFLRSFIASLRGEYLRAWRYGPKTDRLCDEALAREHWTSREWEKWQEERLAVLLYRAEKHVPYYREHWAKRRGAGDRASSEVLSNWPLLEKDTLRENPRAFVADDRSISRMFHDHTSGTSGKPLDIWLSRETVQTWYALFEARCRRWNGVSRHDRWAIIGGQLVAAAHQDAPPFWVWNAPLHQLYLSAYHLAPRHIASYVDALDTYRVQYLVGYPSAIHTIARAVLEQQISPPRLRVVLVNAEPMLENQRREIAEAFGCPVRETYGMAEIVAAASECEHGTLHLWPDVGVLETVEIARESDESQTREFVCTGLLSMDMPLIRYRVGDCGQLDASGTTCECGRTLPAIRALDGRSDDILYTIDGRAVGRLDPVFKSRLPISEAQIVQETLDRIRVRYVAMEGFTSAHSEALADRIRERMGPVNVVLDQVNAIPRTANGKFRAVVCELSAEERKKVRL